MQKNNFWSLFNKVGVSTIVLMIALLGCSVGQPNNMMIPSNISAPHVQTSNTNQADKALIDESIQSAISVSRQPAIRSRLQILLASGTPAEKADFVRGSETEYTFPQRINNLMETRGIVCETTCYLLCRYVRQPVPGVPDQEKMVKICKKNCKKVCSE